jgi:hypothetical protein
MVQDTMMQSLANSSGDQHLSKSKAQDRLILGSYFIVPLECLIQVAV